MHSFKIEMADSHGNIIQRVNHRNIKGLQIRIIDRCSVTLKPLNSEELRASIPLEVMDTNFVTFSQDLGVLEASSNLAQNEAKNNTEIVEFLNKEYSKESVESLNNSTLINSIIDFDKEAIETQDTCVNSVEYEEIDSHLNEKYDEEFMGIDYRDDGRISFFIDDFDKPATKVQKITVEENLRHYTLFGESQYLGVHEHFYAMPAREKLSSQNSFGNRIKIVNHPAIHSGTS